MKDNKKVTFFHARKKILKFYKNIFFYDFFIII